mmetsp:Transcript_66660/g.201200  ORF Transcript_66660/g.201200 Transcript_66660/m.201200 type:complete len:205 (-) Transcript_66660:245-859(-)
MLMKWWRQGIRAMGTMCMTQPGSTTLTSRTASKTLAITGCLLMTLEAASAPPGETMISSADSKAMSQTRPMSTLKPLTMICTACSMGVSSFSSSCMRESSLQEGSSGVGSMLTRGPPSAGGGPSRVQAESSASRSSGRTRRAQARRCWRSRVRSMTRLMAMTQSTESAEVAKADQTRARASSSNCRYMAHSPDLSRHQAMAMAR